MMNKLNTIVSVLIFLSAWISTAVFAASDGTLGATSSGTSDVTLTINDLVRITGVDDIALGAYGGSGALTGQSEYCVFRNGGDNYKLNLTSTGGVFQVVSVTTSDSIAFTVKVDGDTDASNGETLTHGVDSAAMVGSPSLTCSSSDNASMYVSFAEADMLAVTTASDYTATVILLVSPI